MENFIPKLGDFVVLRINEKCTEKSAIGYSAVYWINNDFPLNHYNSIMELGHFDVREATEIEKEYCYSTCDRNELPIVDLEDIDRWVHSKDLEGGKNG